MDWDGSKVRVYIIAVCICCSQPSLWYWRIAIAGKLILCSYPIRMERGGETMKWWWRIGGLNGSDCVVASKLSLVCLNSGCLSLLLADTASVSMCKGGVAHSWNVEMLGGSTFPQWPPPPPSSDAYPQAQKWNYLGVLVSWNEASPIDNTKVWMHTTVPSFLHLVP